MKKTDSTTKERASRRAAPHCSQFPDRVVLAVGFPWATGTGKKSDPHRSLMMLRGRVGVSSKRLAFPRVLWSTTLPKYRLVLERVYPANAAPRLRGEAPAEPR